MEKQVEFVRPDQSVSEAAACMRDEDIGFLPVCDDKGKVIGVITDRDLAIRVLAERKDGSVLVKDVMTRDAVSCRPDDELRSAEELLASEQVSRVMCLAEDGTLAGVISLADVARRDRTEKAGETLREVKQPDTPIH